MERRGAHGGEGRRREEEEGREARGEERGDHHADKVRQEERKNRVIKKKMVLPGFMQHW